MTSGPATDDAFERFFADEYALPSLVGLTEAYARDRVERLGLAVNVTYVEVPAGDDRDGTVIEQGLVAGSSVEPGTPVALTVAVATP